MGTRGGRGCCCYLYSQADGGVRHWGTGAAVTSVHNTMGAWVNEDMGGGGCYC